VTQVIYKIVNLVNDKFYVGSTNNQRERFRTHRNKLRRGVHHCAHLQASWNKYGEEKFAFRVVAYIPDGESLQEAEDHWLMEHVGKPDCYNVGLRSGAPMRGIPKEKHPAFGKPKTEEQRAAISATLKAFYAEDYANHPRVGKTHSEDTKERIRQAKLANPQSFWLGKTRSEETRKKISEAQIGIPGRTLSEAEREAIRQRTLGNQHWLGKTHTEEAKDKMRRPIYAILPDGTRRDFVGVSAAGKELGVAYPMLVRSMKAGKPIAKGRLAGWLFVYADLDQGDSVC
jgi:group I intron endonuclease